VKRRVIRNAVVVPGSQLYSSMRRTVVILRNEGERMLSRGCSVDDCAYILRNEMRRFASIVAMFLLLAAAMPVLACVTGTAMSRMESSCCRETHGRCGEMAKQGCCQTETQTDSRPQIATSTVATEPQWVCVAQLPAPFAVPLHGCALELPQTPPEHSPPGLVTAKITVLRI